MTGYKVFSLYEILKEQNEERVKKEILSLFSCPYNKDVEKFLRNSAIQFEKQGLSRTFLVYASVKQKPELVGYFALSTKAITVPDKKLKKGLRQRIARFANRQQDVKEFHISASLIGQLSKNYTDGLNKYIKGEELLEIAIQKVKKAQMIVGGKVVYIECEDIPHLIQFYSDNGFVEFQTRKKEHDEITEENGDYLVQMLRYLKDK